MKKKARSILVIQDRLDLSAKLIQICKKLGDKFPNDFHLINASSVEDKEIAKYINNKAVAIIILEISSEILINGRFNLAIKLAVEFGFASIVLVGNNLNKLKLDKDLELLLLSQSGVVAGVLDYSWPDPFFFPALIGLLDFVQTKDKFRKEIESIYSNQKHELERIKDLHERLVPQRLENFKGLKILGKFWSGMGPGGEFFDSYKFGSHLFFFLSSSNSYETSSKIIIKFQAMIEKKKKISWEQVLEFLINLIKINPNIELCAFIVDMNTLMMEGVKTDGIKFISDHNQIWDNIHSDFSSKEGIEKATFSVKLKRGEKLVVISPGVLFNWNRKFGNLGFDKIIKDDLERPPKDILDDLFYKLRKNEESKFLERDASAIYFEVEKNVIVQI